MRMVYRQVRKTIKKSSTCSRKNDLKCSSLATTRATTVHIATEYHIHDSTRKAVMVVRFGRDFCNDETIGLDLHPAAGVMDRVDVAKILR